MDIAFKYENKPARKPIIFETIFAEKSGGGLLANSPVDLREGLAVGLNSEGKYAPIKALILVEDALSDASIIKVAKNSGVAVNEAYAIAKKSVAVTEVDTTSSGDYDVLGFALGVSLRKGDILYQARSTSASSAAPVVEPLYILGQDVEANSGDMMVKLVNGANIRKESAPVADAVVALMKSIAKI